MTTLPELLAFLSKLHEEDELAGPAALASNVAHHYDRGAGALMRSGELRVVGGLLRLVSDPRVVRRMDPPCLPLDGGYGKTFGAVTVGEKARFILQKMLPAASVREALAKGPLWLEANRARLRWDETARQFKLR